MIREWVGDEPLLKGLALVLLLPLAGVNAYFIVAGLAGTQDPEAYLPGLGFLVAMVGAIGLAIQLALMNVARRRPGMAGAIMLIVAFVLFLPGAGLGLLGFTQGWLFLLSPLPGAALFLVAAWHHGRVVERDLTAWRSQPPSWR